eukprot:scaffold1501_cov352-Pavlova_lutheri.AAC.11
MGEEDEYAHPVPGIRRGATAYPTHPSKGGRRILKIRRGKNTPIQYPPFVQVSWDLVRRPFEWGLQPMPWAPWHLGQWMVHTWRRDASTACIRSHTCGLDGNAGDRAVALGSRSRVGWADCVFVSICPSTTKHPPSR